MQMLLKNTLKKIAKSFGRYFSLVAIIFLGVAFYTGIIESVPNIKDVQSNYYNDTNLFDLKVISNIGIDSEDVTSINDISGVKKAVGTYSLDTLVDGNVVRLHAIEKEINRPYLITGRMPKGSNECLADDNSYSVGDIIKLNGDISGVDVLEYTVVGTIYSPVYTSDDYGSSSIGNGKLSSYLYIPKDNFNFPYYTECFVEITKNKKDVPYSDSYNKKVNKITKKIEEVKEKRINDKNSMPSYLGRTDSITNMISMPDWFILDRNSVISSYQILKSQYNQVITIANVIPIFFILIVILMTSNTMSRMITEERSEMGTLLSLGYSNRQVIKTYLWYVLSATIIGAVTGFFAGTIILPKLVYNCFPINVPSIKYNFRLPLFLVSLITSIILMSAVTLTSCLKQLRQRPAYLLRPVAPKSGKKIFLERIGFIWNRLSFSSKITFRNISRYKKRVIITLLGTCGCTFLVMIGLALRDSINTVGDKQYNELFKFDNMIVLNNSIDKITNDEGIDELISDKLLLKEMSLKVVSEDNSLDVYLVVPEDNNGLFKEYYKLRDATNKKELILTSDGAIVTPKIADRFNLKVGDYFKVEDLDKKSYKLKVTGITENYVSNYIYINKDTYEKIFKEKVTYNTIVSNNKVDGEKVAVELLKNQNVFSVSLSDDLLESANGMVEGLDEIVILLVIISSLLAFTVLYNLTSINISERTREIATLKVLGFRMRESNDYIYREIMLTVILGIALGLLITPPLHNLVMDLLEVDALVFLRYINPLSYVFAGCLTLFFAIIMMVVTYFKIEKIDMIESLKSVE